MQLRHAVLCFMALLSMAQALGTVSVPAAAVPIVESARLCIALALLYYSKHRRRPASFLSRHAPPLLLIAVVALAVCAPPVRADGGITIGSVFTVVSTIWGIISTIGQVIIWILVILEFTITYTIAFSLAAFIFINTLDGFSYLTNFSVAQWIERRLLEALQCEPVDPEYGMYRSEDFEGAPRPSPVPYVVQRRRRSDTDTNNDSLPQTSPGPSSVPIALGA